MSTLKSNVVPYAKGTAEKFSNSRIVKEKKRKK